ncbi:hypothetical protein PIB30_024526 [Stylosanthes scabra]|nr:hypothetical protein [Stylosanthes scabra]
MMETEERGGSNKGGGGGEPSELFLQWGNRKRIRCVRVKDPRISTRLNAVVGGITRKLVHNNNNHKETSHLHPNRLTRNSDGAILRSSGGGDNRKSASPEKEDRYYTTRGSAAVTAEENNGKNSGDGNNGEERAVVWPKLYITLSSKEKEEDFLAMKGCKLPQRPKKRAKIIQRSLLLVSPGAWLTDMCQERYEVREKKSSKKRPRGLKAMGSMESDSE